MTSVDSATLLLTAPVIWFLVARLCLLMATIPEDTTNNIPTQDVWLHTPQLVTATEDVTIFYDKGIPVGRFIENGAIKPDIVVIDFSINRAEREKVIIQGVSF